MCVVSVVIAAWNAEAFIDAAIEQMSAQTMEDFEVVVVDDGSVDTTTATLEKWCAEDPRVVLLRNEVRQGVAASRNLALSKAKGEYIWFADVDDRWSPEILTRLLAHAEATQADVVVCRARAIRIDSREEIDIAGPCGPPIMDGIEAVRRLMRREIQGYLWNKLFHRSLFDGVAFPATRAYSDLGAMGHLLVRARRVALFDDALYTYVVRPGSILNSRELRARDLLDCRAEMRAAISQLSGSPAVDADFLVFEYASVYIPTLHELIRRYARDGESRAVREEVSSMMTASDIVRLLRMGQWRLAAAATGLKYASSLYSAAYVAFRRLKWGSAGYWSR